MSASSVTVRSIAGLHLFSMGANLAEASRVMDKAKRERKVVDQDEARNRSPYSLRSVMGPTEPTLAEAYPPKARMKLASAGLNLLLGIALNVAATKLGRR